jgi:hypothetical protein
VAAGAARGGNQPNLCPEGRVAQQGRNSPQMMSLPSLWSMIMASISFTGY